MKISVFSTMAERGVLGGFLGFAVVPMILSPKVADTAWLGRRAPRHFKYPACSDAHGHHPRRFVRHDLCHGQQRDGILADGYWLYRHYGGGMVWNGSHAGGAISSRIDFPRFGNIQEDGSFQGRMEIYQYSVASILLNPIGYGLGATGISGRINAGSTG